MGDGVTGAPFRLRALTPEETQQRFAVDLDLVLEETREMLKAKNRAYGDSALNPVRILSKASPRDQILSRIDDKLKRVSEGDEAGEDVWFDLLGYFVLLRIFDLRQKRLAPGG